MSWRLLPPLAVAALGTAILSLVYQRYRLLLPGDVNDLDGRPIQGCTVELLVRCHFLDRWTVYAAKEVTTDSEGAFSFGVFRVPWTRYRLRTVHPGYEESVLEASFFRVPRRVHITLLPVSDLPRNAVLTRS